GLDRRRRGVQQRNPDRPRARCPVQLRSSRCSRPGSGAEDQVRVRSLRRPAAGGSPPVPICASPGLHRPPRNSNDRRARKEFAVAGRLHPRWPLGRAQTRGIAARRGAGTVQPQDRIAASMKEIPTRIDSHHHFWDPTRATYPWMVGDAMDPVRRPFTPDDLAPELAAQRISGTVLVQTISSEDETREFLELAARTDFVWGVVGWVDLTSAQVGDHIDALIGATGGDRLVGIRHQVHDEADPEWLCRAEVRRGLAAVKERGLT